MASCRSCKFWNPPVEVNDAGYCEKSEIDIDGAIDSCEDWEPRDWV